MRTHTSRTLLTRSLAVMAVAAVLGACGSEGSSSAGGDSADGTTPLTMQAAWVNDAEFMGYFIGIDEGLYSDAGIDLTYLSGGPNVIPESTLLSGEADIALTSPDTTITAITEQGADFVIIGAQYQRSPLGIVSLAESGITEAADLAGKTVAVPDVNRLAFDAMLAINNVDASTVTVVPYAYDPTPLISGEVDATLDFVTNVPFTIEEQGHATNSFTRYDAGERSPNDTVVVSRETLDTTRDAIAAWLQASITGWQTNFEDPAKYPPLFESTWFDGTGRTIDNELYFNTAQQPLIESPTGLFRLSDEAIADTIATLALIDIEATPEMFDMSLFE